MSNLDRDITDRPAQPVKKNRKIWLIVSIVILLLICLCVASSAALLYFDPFDWGILGRFFGGYDAIARTVPANTDVHFSADMLKLLSGDSQAVMDAFASNSGDPGVSSREEMIQKMDETLMADYGVTFSDDIMPWVGQYAGVSLFDLSLAQEMDVDHWVIAAEVRDRRKADASLEKLSAFLGQEYGTPVETTTYEGATLYAGLGPDGPMAAGRHKNILFISNSVENIQEAIDADKGESLADDANYKAVISQLPASRMLTAYFSRGVFQELTALAGEAVMNTQTDPGAGQNSGLALSLVDAGIKVDILGVYDLDSMTQAQLDNLSFNGAEGKLAESMPEDVLLFLTGRDMGHAWENLLAYLEETGGLDADEVSESMMLLEGQIGFNPERDLFPYLDQEWSLALVRERNSLLSEQLDLPIGLLCIAETSNPDQLNLKVQETADKLGGIGLIMIDEKTIGDMTYYEASAFMMGNPLLAFGMRQNQFLLSTSPDRLENLDDGGAVLSGTELWKSTWSAMPGQMNPILYADLKSLVAIFPDFELAEVPYLQPLHTLALAGSPLDGNTKHWVLMLTIE